MAHSIIIPSSLLYHSYIILPAFLYPNDIGMMKECCRNAEGAMKGYRISMEINTSKEPVSTKKALPEGCAF
jgi:hypothetical protein